MNGTDWSVLLLFPTLERSWSCLRCLPGWSISFLQEVFRRLSLDCIIILHLKHTMSWKNKQEICYCIHKGSVKICVKWWFNDLVDFSRGICALRCPWVRESLSILFDNVVKMQRLASICRVGPALMVWGQCAKEVMAHLTDINIKSPLNPIISA